MKKITTLASVALLAVAGSAVAEQALTDVQMDGVSAGAVVLLQGSAIGGSYGNVISNLLGTTATNTLALADPTGALTATLGVAVGYADSTSIATSVTNGGGIGGAYAQSTSGAAASIF